MPNAECGLCAASEWLDDSLTGGLLKYHMTVSIAGSVLLVPCGNRAINCFVSQSLEMQITNCAGLKNELKINF